MEVMLEIATLSVPDALHAVGLLRYIVQTLATSTLRLICVLVVVLQLHYLGGADMY